MGKKHLIGIDTETTGLDIYHGCLPYFVGCTEENGTEVSWEWEVDPYTRKVNIPEQEKKELREYLKDKRLIFHNAIFDIVVLQAIGVDPVQIVGWGEHRRHLTSFACTKLCRKPRIKRPSREVPRHTRYGSKRPTEGHKRS